MSEEQQNPKQETALSMSDYLSVIVPESIKQIEELKSLIELNARATIAARMITHRNPASQADPGGFDFDLDKFEKIWAAVSEGYPVTDFSDEAPAATIPANGAVIQEQ